MDSKELALKCRELADNKKAEDLVILDVRKLSSVTDFFVIGTGSSEPHLRAITDEIEDVLLKESAVKPRARDGNINDSWIVIDYFDVIVHIMRGDARTRYDLEGLWRDAPRIDPGKAEVETLPSLVPTPKPKRASKTKTAAAPKKRVASRKKPAAAD